MSIKLLLIIFPFAMLIHNIPNNLYASNTISKTTEHEQDANNKEDNDTDDAEDNDKEDSDGKSESGEKTEEEPENESDTQNDDQEDSEEDEYEAGTAEYPENNEEDLDDNEENDESDDGTEEDPEEIEDDEEDDAYADQDPFESLNRKMHNFNEKMSSILDKFSSKDKNKSKPSNISKAIGNFSHNFFEMPRVINYGLQGNIKNMSNTIARLIINTTLGFFGVTDVAEKLGFPKNRTYFGDTLKKWGMKPGPYVVLPILGPTSLRGAVGQAFETIPLQTAKLPLNNLKPLAKNAIYYATYCSSLLASRSAYSDMIEQVSAMSKDKYKTFRNIIMSMESN